MKWIAIGFNLLLIATMIYMFITQGAPHKDDAFVVAVCFAAPITSLFALRSVGSENWISLFFKRKALEEKSKIEKLSKVKEE